MSIDTGKFVRSNRHQAATAKKPGKIAGPMANWADERLGLGTVMKKQVRKVFPDHWSFMLGEIALWSFVVLLITGIFLTLWFQPSMAEVQYEGSYDQLRGIHMSQAYASTLDISFDVRGGLLLRQMHHWSAMLFIAAMLVHLMRTFLTGAFRKPRELNWVIGGTLLLLGILEGFAGYSLPDDLLSGTGLRIADGIVKATPVLGSYMSFFVFGGEFPGEIIIPRLYIAHVLLIPGLILALITAHMLLLVYHKHTQWPGPGRTEKNVVGFPMLPVYAAKAGGFFFIVFGVTALMGGLLAINPVWKYGPYDPSKVTAGSQPDWYMGIAEGLLRIMPGWETHVFGTTWSWNVMLPAQIAPILLLTVVLLWPFLEAWVTGDKREHHLLQRPAQRADPDRVPRRGDHALRPALGSGRQRHPRGGLRPEPELHHVLHAGRDLRRAGAGVHPGPTVVHLAAAARQRAAAARLRDGHHHALPRGRLQRTTPADQRRPGLHAHRARPRPDLRGRVGCRRQRRPRTRLPDPLRPGQAVRRRCSATTCRSRPGRSSTRATTTPSTSRSSRPVSTTPPTVTSSTATTPSRAKSSAPTDPGPRRPGASLHRDPPTRRQLPPGSRRPGASCHPDPADPAPVATGTVRPRTDGSCPQIADTRCPGAARRACMRHANTHFASP